MMENSGTTTTDFNKEKKNESLAKIMVLIEDHLSGKWLHDTCY
jgi:hypothetical protein